MDSSKLSGSRSCRGSLVLVFGGAARVRRAFGQELAQLGSHEIFLPVEAWLYSTLPCGAFFAALRRFHAGQEALHLILCGHSFGAAVARSTAARLAICNVAVRGLVAMDDRAMELLSWVQPSVPRGLLASLTPLRHRLEVQFLM